MDASPKRAAAKRKLFESLPDGQKVLKAVQRVQTLGTPMQMSSLLKRQSLSLPFKFLRQSKNFVSTKPLHLLVQR